MEENINVAEILKDKPVGLKLYSNTFGYISFNVVHKDKIYFLSEDDYTHSVKSNGKLYDDGECVVFPSKEMRDWSKFSWKKGDVLVSNDGKIEVIFEKFGSDTYQSFIGKHHLDSLDENLYYQDGGAYPTASFNIETEDAAQTYINTIEKRLGRKLNRETLEVEKPQPEFKDGDIVYMGNAWNEYIGIIKNIPSGNQIETYAHCHKDSKEGATLGLWLNKNDSDEFRLATDSEKQQLFDALAKKGKRWNAKKKKVVDLPKKSEFKPMDWCLMRGGKEHFVSDWTLCQFSHKMECGKYRAVGGCAYDECISYNDQTKHLLGTTDEWKGGEG